MLDTVSSSFSELWMAAIIANDKIRVDLPKLCVSTYSGVAEFDRSLSQALVCIAGADRVVNG